MVRLSVVRIPILLIFLIAVFATNLSMTKRRSVPPPLLQQAATYDENTTINSQNTLEEDALPLPRPNKTSQYINSSRKSSKQYDEENGRGRRRVPANPMSSLLNRGTATAVSRDSGSSGSLNLDIRKLDHDVITSQVSGGTSMIAISTVMVFATFVAF